VALCEAGYASSTRSMEACQVLCSGMDPTDRASC